LNLNKKFIPFFPVFLILKIVIKNGGISFNYSLRLLTHILRSVIFEPFRLIELIIFNNKINNHEITQDPIFIIGHWRSGTSHLQKLLRQDKNNTSIGIFSSIFSSSFILTSTIIKPLVQKVCDVLEVEYSIQRTPLDLDYPGELDTGLCFLPNEHSYTWGHMFPAHFKKYMDDCVFNDDSILMSKWLDDYDYLIKKVSYYSKGKRVIVKSPGDTGRIKYLQQRYPRARFVYIHREPLEVYHSNVFLWTKLRDQFCLQSLTDEQIHKNIVQTYPKLINRYIEQREQIKKGFLVEITFKQLIEEPLKTIEKTYSTLDLGVIPVEELKIEINKNTYETNEYITPQNLESELKSTWGDLIYFYPRKI